MAEREGKPSKADQRTERDKRLAEALRANLKRRKVAAKQEKPAGSDAGSSGRT